MAVLLIITTVDVLGRRNNREHHVIAHMAPHFDRVIVVFRRRSAAGKRMRELLRSCFETTVQNEVTYVAVDPMLNAPEGTTRDFVARSAGGLRSVLGQLLDLAGILRDWLTIRALANAARRVVPADTVVCEAFGPWATAAAHTLKSEQRIRRYIYVDRDFEPGFMTTTLRRKWASRAEARAASQADLTLSIGHRLAARFRGIAGANVHYSPTGVDCAMFAPVLRETPLPHLIFVGQIAAWSGIEEVLAAMALLADVPGLRLTVLGPAEAHYRAQLQARIAAMRSVVDWRGDLPRDQVAEALATAGIGLATFRPHPLRIHAAPLKLLEYMASGLPIIALAGSEAGDFVTRAGVGVTCATDGAAIALAVRRTLDDPVAYAQMSAAGPVAARAHDWSVVLGRELDLLGQLDMLTLKSGTP